MERLTEKSIGAFAYRLKNHKAEVGEFNTYDAFYDYSMALKRLGEFEDAEEQGRIVVLPEPTPDIDFMQIFNLAMAGAEDRAIILPCKVGDTIYYIKTLQNGADTKVIEQDTVKRIILDGIDNQIVISYGHAFMMCDFNRLLFLSREEAEKALEGMK